MARKLPVFAAIRHVVLLTFKNLGPALRISWAWMVVFAIVTGLFAMIVDGIDILSPTASDLVSMATALAIYVFIALVATASIAVAWHRYILLDEGGNVAFNLRVDGIVWRYVGNAIVIGISAILLIGIPIFILMQATQLGVLLLFPALLLLAPVLYRMGIKLPAIALGQKDFAFSDAFDASTGNYWQLVGLAAIYFLLAIAFNLAVALITFMSSLFGPLALVVQVIATAVAEWIGIIFGVSLMTTLYGYFVEDRSFDD